MMLTFTVKNSSTVESVGLSMPSPTSPPSSPTPTLPKRKRKKKPPIGDGRFVGINRRNRKGTGVPEGWETHPFLEREVGAFTLVWKVVKMYLSEHAYRRKSFAWFIESVIGDFLTMVTGCNPDNGNTTMHAFTRQNLVAFKQKLQAGPGSPKTLNQKIGVIHTFLAWCQNNGFIDENLRLPSAGLKVPARLVKKVEVRKMPFSPEQYSLVLQASFLLDCRSKKRPVDTEKYWCLMLLATSGARLNEVVPLLKSDVQQEPSTGVWFFNIYEDESRQRFVKNQFSTRAVPLHRQLIELEFLEYLNGVKTVELFPTLCRLHGSGVSYWFNSILRRIKLKSPALSLHSTRHTMTVMLEKARVHPSIRHRLMGHSLGNGVEERTYLAGLQYSMSELQEALDSVTLPIDMQVHRV